jgi:hypothetical protein
MSPQTQAPIIMLQIFTMCNLPSFSFLLVFSSHHISFSFLFLTQVNDGKYFSSDDFAKYHEHIDKISLMTYDFSNGKAGPSSPLPWVEHSVRTFLGDKLLNNAEARSKILTGINFYGMRFNAQGQNPVRGGEFIKVSIP